MHIKPRRNRNEWEDARTTALRTAMAPGRLPASRWTSQITTSSRLAAGRMQGLDRRRYDNCCRYAPSWTTFSDTLRAPKLQAYRFSFTLALRARQCEFGVEQCKQERVLFGDPRSSRFIKIRRPSATPILSFLESNGAFQSAAIAWRPYRITEVRPTPPLCWDPFTAEAIRDPSPSPARQYPSTFLNLTRFLRRPEEVGLREKQGDKYISDVIFLMSYVLPKNPSR